MENEKQMIDPSGSFVLKDGRYTLDFGYGFIQLYNDEGVLLCQFDIDDIPTVDAVPVVHGRWEVVHGVLTPGGDPLLRCAICKSRESEHLCGIECRTVWNYCPNCGAKMDLEG